MISQYKNLENDKNLWNKEKKKKSVFLSYQCDKQKMRKLHTLKF